jgi:hypothetical protein
MGGSTNDNLITNDGSAQDIILTAIQSSPPALKWNKLVSYDPTED